MRRRAALSPDLDLSLDLSVYLGLDVDLRGDAAAGSAFGLGGDHDRDQVNVCVWE